MHEIDIGPINNNPQTMYKLVFGQNVPAKDVLEALTRSAQLRQQLGLTTEANTLATVLEATQKLANINS